MSRTTSGSNSTPVADEWLDDSVPRCGWAQRAYRERLEEPDQWFVRCANLGEQRRCAGDDERHRQVGGIELQRESTETKQHIACTREQADVVDEHKCSVVILALPVSQPAQTRR